MLYIIAIIFAIVAGIVLKGKMSNLLNIKFEKTWLILLAFAVLLLSQIGMSKFDFIEKNVFMVQIIIFCLLLAGFWFNKHYAGICIIGIGYILNFLVIMANGGKMPVSVETLRKANIALTAFEPDIKHALVQINEGTRLSFLADIIHPPFFLSYLNQIMSVGDLIVAVGLFLLALEIISDRNLGIKNRA